MGLLAPLTDSIRSVLTDRSAPFVLGAGVAAFLVLAVVVNVLQQLLLKKPNEPPIVFHWLPFFGSTITYGIDPYKFFFECREKVR